MPGHDIVVIGASAGGVEAIMEVAKGLPPALPAALFVVCHFPSTSQSALPAILSRVGPLLAKHAVDGEHTFPGHIYVAPPDHHMLIGKGIVELTKGPRENRQRPAIDPLFLSAARVYGPRVLALILSGTSTDGVAGLMAVRTAGGIGIVQDPADALFPALPLNAQRIAHADHISSLAKLPSLLVELIQSPVEARPLATAEDHEGSDGAIILKTFAEQIQGERQGNVTTLTCPDCGGCLWQFDDHSLLEYRCHTGHRYHATELLEGQSQVLESALWSAVRIFREKMILARQLAHQERQRNNLETAQRFEEEATLCEDRSNIIQKNLLKRPNGSGSAWG